MSNGVTTLLKINEVNFYPAITKVSMERQAQAWVGILCGRVKVILHGLHED